MAKHDVISPKGRQSIYENHNYSAAIRSGNLLFVSRQVGSLEDGSPELDLAKGSTCFDNLATVLEAAGCTLDDVVEVSKFHTDLAAQFETVQPIRKRAIQHWASPEPDRGRRSLSFRLRLRDQGYRSHPCIELSDQRDDAPEHHGAGGRPLPKQVCGH